MDMLEPGKFGTAVQFKKRYVNYIGGEWVAPAENQYFENITPYFPQVAERICAQFPSRGKFRGGGGLAGR